MGVGRSEHGPAIFRIQFWGRGLCLTLKYECWALEVLGAVGDRRLSVTLTQVPCLVKKWLEKLRQRELYSQASGHTASKWQSWDSNLGVRPQIPLSCLFYSRNWFKHWVEDS